MAIDYKALIADPNIIDPTYDITGFKTQTETNPLLLGNVAEYPGVRYDPTHQDFYSNLFALHSTGMPLKPVTDTAPIFDASVNIEGGGGGGGGGGPNVVNTPFEQNLLDQGVGVQRAPGDPVVAPGEMPVTQEEINAFNQIPVTPANLQDPTKMLPQIPEVIADDPTKKIPQLGSETPSYIGGDIPLEDTGAIEELGQVMGADYQGEPFKPKISNPFLVSGAAGNVRLTEPQTQVDWSPLDDLEADLGAQPTELGTEKSLIDINKDRINEIGTSISEFLGNTYDRLNNTVEIAGKKINLASTAARAVLNDLAGAPISLIIDALGAIPKSLPSVNEQAVLNNFQTDDTGRVIGDPNKSAFAGLNAESLIGDPVKGAKNRIDTRLETIKDKNYTKGDNFYDDTMDMIKEYETVLESTLPSSEVGFLEPDKTTSEQLKDLEELEKEKRDLEIATGIEAAEADKDEGEIKEDTIDWRENIEIPGIEKDEKAEIDKEEFDPGAGFVDQGGLGEFGTGTSTSRISRTDADYGQFGRAQQRQAEETKGGGGGGGGKSIVCTAMYQTTGLEDWSKAMKIWYIYQKKYLTIQHQEGYHKLFKPFVKGMHKSSIIKAIGAHVARHRTQDLKHVMFGSKPSWLGRVYRKILEPICYWVGKYAKR